MEGVSYSFANVGVLLLMKTFVRKTITKKIETHVTVVWNVYIFIFPRSRPEQRSAAEISCDSHHGITELFGAAAFDLKPLSLSQNAHLACADGGCATLRHEKAAEPTESELNECASFPLSACWSIAQRSTRDNYLWVAHCCWWSRDGEKGHAAVFLKINNPLHLCQENKVCSFERLNCIQQHHYWKGLKNCICQLNYTVWW